MEKSYFEKRKAGIQSEIDSWQQELKDLEDEYISSNQKFPVGSKICITTPACTGWTLRDRKTILIPEKKDYAYVTGYTIYGNEVTPVLKKAKKDGSISKVRGPSISPRDTVELA